MHSHAPRLILPLTAAHAVQRFPSGEIREDRFPAGGVHWAPQVMVHEIRNIGSPPVWAIVVEHVQNAPARPRGLALPDQPAARHRQRSWPSRT